MSVSDSRESVGAPRAMYFDSAVFPVEASAREERASGSEQTGVAIIGMSCLFPGARDLDAYWRNILGKFDAVTDPPPESWDASVFFDPTSTDPDRVYCKRGGYLGSLVNFDPLTHGIPPVAVGGEPDQWLALQLARDALTDAGYEQMEESLRKKTAVILGKGTYLNAGNGMAIQHGVGVTQTLDLLKSLHPDLTPADLEELRQDLHRTLPPMGPETVPGLIPNVIVGRIANRLDLMGPTYTVDAACASSLIAVQIAMRELMSGSCGMALVGGTQVWMPVPILSVFCQLGALSRRQQIRPFDKDADGTLLGEGIGMLVLKRLDDAERDGDRIYAVIRGVGVASDGRGLSVMAPRIEGEELALRRAYESAHVSPSTVGLIEAHGTGTPVGDLTEVQALTRVFSARKGELAHCALGSVKSMISHTIPAAGAAGLIKVAMSLYHKVLPPTLNCPEPNPKLELEKTPFYINTEARPWVHGGAEPRRAGVNAFGFGGINAHVVVEEYVPSTKADRIMPSITTGPGARAAVARSTHHGTAWDSEVCILNAPTPAILLEKVRMLESYLASADAAPPRLLDVAFTLSQEWNKSERAHGCRLSVVATSIDDLRAKLAKAAQRLADPTCSLIREVSGLYYSSQPLGREGKVAFLIPGEGAQYPNMLADLCLHFPEVRAQFDQTDAIYAKHPRGYRTSDYLFPRPAHTAHEREWAEERLWKMDGAMEAVLTADLALLAVLERLKVRPDAILGHSSGEYVALRAGGILDLHDEERWAWFARALENVYDEAALGEGVPQAELVAIGAGREQVDAIVREVGEGVFVAMDNCLHQVVLAGEPSAMARVKEIARRDGIIIKPLSFDRPYHTPLFEAYSKHLRRAIDQLPLAPARVPVYSCTTSAPFPTDAASTRDLMVEHWVRPVEFFKTIQTMHDEGFRLFVEVGPRGNLSAFVEDILRGRPFLAVPSNVQRRSGMKQLNHLVGLLVAEGVDLDPTYLYERRSPQLIDWDAPRVSTTGSSARATTRTKLETAYPLLKISDELARRLLGRRPAPPAQAVAAAPISPVVHAPQETHRPAPPLPPIAAPAYASPAQPIMAVAVQSFLQTMELFLETQEKVMKDLLRGKPGILTVPTLPTSPVPVASGNGLLYPEPIVARPPAPAPTQAPLEPLQTSTVIASSPEVIVSQVEAVQASPPSPVDRLARLSAKLLEIVSDRTGYPIEMLDWNLDLEADLGIDSIKRVEILGSFRQQADDLGEVDLEQLTTRRTLQQIIDMLSPVSDSPAPAPAPVAAPVSSTPRSEGRLPEIGAYPLLGGVVSWADGEELVTERTFDPSDDLYLRDHTLGHAVSVFDPDLSALAVLPLTMSLEILAEAAACLSSRTVVGLRDVNAFRWVAFDGTPQTLRVTARRVPGANDRVTVQLRNLTEDAQSANPHRSPVVEATVLLGDAYPPAPSKGLTQLGSLRPSRLAPESLYTEVMFHGPAWQGVQTIEQTSDRGTVTFLRVLPVSGFFRGNPAPRFVLDPVVLDAAGQVIGFWTMEHLTHGRVIFPFHLDALDLYRPGRPTGETVTCRASIALLGEHQVRSDIDVIAADGQPWMRLTGWDDKRFDLPAHLVGLLLPDGEPISHGLPELAASLPASERVEVRAIAANLASDRAFWKRVWGHCVLSREEREVFHRLPLTEEQQVEWLAVRTAAKEAVHQLLRRHHGLDARPADIEIRSDEWGRPRVDGPWIDSVPGEIAVAFAQTEGWAAAVAGYLDGTPEDADESTPKLGLAVADLRALPVGFARSAFTPDELQLLNGLSEEWLLRGWCAREAARSSPAQRVSIVGADASTGLMTIQVASATSSGEEPVESALFAVGTIRQGERVLALLGFSADQPATVVGTNGPATENDPTGNGNTEWQS